MEIVTFHCQHISFYVKRSFFARFIVEECSYFIVEMITALSCVTFGFYICILQKSFMQRNIIVMEGLHERIQISNVSLWPIWYDKLLFRQQYLV